jgi:predicted O-methyltransferase YrrM
MQYIEFYEKYGGSARTKNLEQNSLKNLIKAALRSKEKAVSKEKKQPIPKREFRIPSQTKLPLEFIKLCPWEMEYLFTVARRAKTGIVEIGRFNGGSTFVLTSANPDIPIYSIDIAPKDDDRLKSYFRQENLGSNVELIVGDSRKKYDHISHVDVLFIDGDHTYEGCMADIENWYDEVIPNGHILFHDSYLGSHGVQDAIVDFMKQHAELQVILSPYIGPAYWHWPAGSVCHLIKRG